MKVLINALQAGNRSGTGRYTLELIRALAACTETVQLALLWPEDAEPRDPPFPAEIIRQAGGSARRALQTGRALRAALRSHPADLVHHPASIGPAVPLTPAVLTVHDLIALRHPEWFRWDRALYYRNALRASVRHAARVITDSRATANDLAELLAYPESQIDVVPLGVGKEFRPASETACAEVRRRYRLPERFFLYVGTIEPRKNLERLLTAWSSMVREETPDLVIAGRRGWKTDAFERAVVQSPSRARIHTPGYVEQKDLPAVLSAATAFVWPSLVEGFGLPPLEAMACGAPVLTSNTSSLPETAGDAAILVCPTDTEAIAEALCRLSEDEALRLSLRAKGLARAAQFTWARTAERTVESYRKALR